MSLRVTGITEHILEVGIHRDPFRDVDGFLRQRQRSPQEGIATARVDQPPPTYLTLRQFHAPLVAVAHHILRRAPLAHLTAATGGVIEQYMVKLRALDLKCLPVTGHQPAGKPKSLPA